MYIKKPHQAVKMVLNSMKISLPVLTGILLLVSLANAFVPKRFFIRVFTGNDAIDPLVGAFIGSVAAGNPLTSYVIGGELMKLGVSLAGIAAFIVGWVTVGIIQIPAESLMLGKKFALLRNGISFIMAIIIAFLTSITMGVV